MCFCLHERTRSWQVPRKEYTIPSLTEREVCLIVSVSLTAEDEGGLFRKLSKNRNWKIIGATGGEKLFFFFLGRRLGYFVIVPKRRTIRHGTNAVTNSREQVGSSRPIIRRTIIKPKQRKTRCLSSLAGSRYRISSATLRFSRR